MNCGFALWMIGCFVYFICGYWLGRLSLLVFHRWYARACIHLTEHHSPHCGERLLEYLLFPFISFLPSATRNDLEMLPIWEWEQDLYLLTMSLLWPVKVGWNVLCLLFSVLNRGWEWLMNHGCDVK